MIGEVADAMKQPVFAEGQPPSSDATATSSRERSGSGVRKPAGQKKAGRRQPSRTSGRGTNSPRRPNNAKASGGARLLAPIALVVFAIAMFAVLTADDSGTSTQSTSESTSESTTRTAGGGNDDGESTTSTTTRSSYTVKPGDSFAAIAEKLNLDVNVLRELNPDVDPRALQPGEKLKLK